MVVVVVPLAVDLNLVNMVDWKEWLLVRFLVFSAGGRINITSSREIRDTIKAIRGARGVKDTVRGVRGITTIRAIKAVSLVGGIRVNPLNNNKANNNTRVISVHLLEIPTPVTILNNNNNNTEHLIPVPITARLRLLLLPQQRPHPNNTVNPHMTP
jgi:hypothetical protein